MRASSPVRRAAVAFAIVGLFAAVVPAASAGPLPLLDVIVVVEDGADPLDTALDLTGQQPTHVYRSALNGYATSIPKALLGALRNDDRIVSIELDRTFTIQDVQNDAPWGLDRTDERPLELDGTYEYTSTGAGVDVYVIDTGVRASHSDFAPGQVVAGRDEVGNDADADDCNGHGTHVASTAAGQTYGIAKDATIVPVRVLDCGGSGANSGVIAGMDWVVANHQAGEPAVANLSLGGSASTATDAALQRMIDDGVSVVVAAGNNGGGGGGLLGLLPASSDACDYSPARVPGALTIGASNSDDAKAGFSNRGPCVDLFAPGVDITAAWHSNDDATNTISGTSMASPHVAGVAARLLSDAPGSSPAQIHDQVVSTATDGAISTGGGGGGGGLLGGLLGGGGGGGGDSSTTTRLLYAAP